MDNALAERAATAADYHARTCSQCCHPIIDDEGNPGMFGEACFAGLVLLVVYCDASDLPVPMWAKRKAEAVPGAEVSRG